MKHTARSYKLGLRCTPSVVGLCLTDFIIEDDSNAVHKLKYDWNYQEIILYDIDNEVEEQEAERETVIEEIITVDLHNHDFYLKPCDS